LFLGLCLCQALVWLLLDAQARQWLLPSLKNDRPFALELPFTAADSLQLSHNSKFLFALGDGELRVFRLGARQPLVTAATAACWLPDRDALLAVKSEGTEAILVTLELSDLGRAGCAAREIHRAVLPALPPGALFAFSPAGDAVYIRSEPEPGAAAPVWRVDDRGVTPLPAAEAAAAEWTGPSDGPAGEWGAGAAVFVPAPDGYSRLRLTWSERDVCAARWEIGGLND
jgi:hypothetical protein